MLTRKMIIGMTIAVVFLMNAMCWGTAYYVDPGGSDYNTGLSWADAFATIQQGIYTATTGDTIDVNEGTYYYSYYGNINFWGKAITVRSKDPNDWSVVEATVIDGNNLGSVVTFNAGETSASILEGFTITDGNSNNYGGGIDINDASPTIRNCIIRDNYAGPSGGGMYNSGGDPTISNCIFRDNESYNDGAGIFNSSGNANVTNCMFVKNDAGYSGGAFFNSGSSYTTITNCTFSGNTSSSSGGAIYNGSSMTLTNCILWGDTGNGVPDEIYGSPVVTYSDVEGGFSGAGNINSDPLFVDPNSYDYHLALNSPCIDVGDSNGTYSGQVDIDGNDRVIDNPGKGDGIVDIDMGADETPSGQWYVKPDGNDTDDGKSWNSAFATISHAINQASDYDVIHVAVGTYYDNIDFDGKAITLTSTDPNNPDVVAATVIDANGIGIVVIFNSSEDANSVLRGFTITGGYMGIYCGGTSPTISNCVVTENGSGNIGVAYWTMDDDANNTNVLDSSGYGNHGTFKDASGDPNTQAHHTNGKIDGALSLDAADDYIEVPSDDSLDFDASENYTWVGWLKSNDINDTHKIISKFEADTSGYEIEVHDKKLCVYDDVEGEEIYADTVLGSNTWYHFAFTCKGSYFQFYLNGQPDGSGTLVLVDDFSSELLISRSGFNAIIDNVMIFDRTLSAAEVSALYDYELNTKGGICCVDSASPTVTNCAFYFNYADYGGGMYDVNSSPTLISCVFADNIADVNGGAMYNYNSSPILNNCTFSGNSADGDGGGMYNLGTSDPNLTNCIFWGNEAEGSGDEICNDGSADPNFRFCDIEGSGGSGSWDPNFGSDDGNNIDSDPYFTDANDLIGPDDMFGTIDDGLRLQIVSFCIDAADGDVSPAADISGSGRIDISYINNTGIGDPNYADIGAYESPEIWFVDIDATGSDDGSSWEDAYTDLKDALSGASNGDEVWVAEGTYKPDDVHDVRSVSFELAEGAGVYGGFAGTEIVRRQRDWTAYPAILSGDIGTPNSMSDNSYHVVEGASNAVLDGFWITRGNADGSGYDGVGGGMLNYPASTVMNCFFSDNAAVAAGGMYNYDGALVINCVFINNSASYYGGGVYNSGIGVEITNCTFSDNEATYGGGAMGSQTYNPTVTNCIFWGDTSDEIYNYGTASPVFSYCDIQGCGGSSGWDPNFGTDGGGNIDIDPCFADANTPAGADGILGTLDDGLRLMADSPCVDAADGNTAPSLDSLGLGRIDINDVNNTGTGTPDYTDIGAYECGYDSDIDGMPDWWEIRYGLDPAYSDDAALDADSDDLSNLNEYLAGTDPTDTDSDDDGMPDGWEVDNDFDPLDSSDASEDADNDGLSNLGEYNNNADPYDTDSDDDYMPDGWEVDNGLDPNSATGDDGANGNLDGDDFANFCEYLHGSDPNNDSNIPQSTITITVPTEVGSIQWAVDLSIGGDIIEVLPGRYYETIDFNDSAVTLTGIDPNDWWVVESTIIDGNEASNVVLFESGEEPNSVLTGFTLTNATYGISCSSSSSPTITRCIIEDNSSHGIYCTAGSPDIKNNMIGENTGDGIRSSSSTPPTIKNNWIYNNSDGIEFSSASSAATVRNNTIAYNSGKGINLSSGTAPTINNCIVWGNGDDLYNCSATYSCIKDGDGGTGNISSDPLFIDAGSDDYRLQRTSPCINTGTGTYPDETDIEGQARMVKSIDMGADEVCEVHNTTKGLWYSGIDSEGIQDAIDDANEGDVIVVYEWTFYESIDFDDVNVTLMSTDPNDWTVVECTIIDADDSDANVVTFNSGQDVSSVLTGITLTGGKNGVYCSNSSSPAIITCLIGRNSSSGILCPSGSPTIKRCRIGENTEDGINSSATAPPTIKMNLIYKNEKGINLASATSAATIRNNTIVDNNGFGVYVGSGTEPNISNCIVWGHDGNDLADCNATYSCIEDINDANGIGNITSDPMFVCPDSNVYSVDLSSDCIDAGDPNQTYTGEVGLYGKILDRDEDGNVTLGTIPVYVLCVKKGSTATAPYNTWDTAYGDLWSLITLNRALVASRPEIWVAQGTYTPGTIEGEGPRDATFQLTPSLVIKGGYAGSSATPDLRDIELYETILSGDIGEPGNDSDNSYHVVKGVDGAFLEGLIIEGGNANGSTGNYYGGGIYNWQVDRTLRLEYCTIRKNKAKRGGGMYNGGTYSESWATRSYPSLKNCTFKDNIAYPWDGGGMYNYTSSPRLENCIFQGNTAEDDGGGIHNFSLSHPALINCFFIDNSAGGSGGGMSVYGNCGPVPTNCVFYNNSAISGGAIRNIGWCNYTLTNCTFYGNKSTNNGGGIVNANWSSPTFKNCIFWDNTADVDGDQMYSYVLCMPIISNCDIEDSYYDAGYIKEDGTGTILGTGGEDTIDSDPLFIDEDDLMGLDRKLGTADDGLALIYWGATQNDDSPCIDSGTNDNFPAYVTTDIIGNKRMISAGGGTQLIDMGAYEAMKTYAHWKYDEGTGTVANDSSGYGRDATLKPTGNEPVWKVDAGIFDDALDFDRTKSQYVETDSGFPHIANTITVSAWITMEDVEKIGTGNEIIASKNNVWYLRREGLSGTIRFIVNHPLLTSSVLGTVKVDDRLWHHVVGVFDGTNEELYLYIDGQLDSSFPAQGGYLYNNTNKVYIGSNSGIGKFWDGMIDDFRIYDYALDAEQAKILFDEAGYWRFVVVCDSRDDAGGSSDPDDPDKYDGVNNKRFQEIAEAIIAEKAEFVVFPGDLVKGSGAGLLIDQLNCWKGGDDFSNNLMHDVYDAGITVMPVRGNHEIHGDDPSRDWKAVFPGIPDNGPDNYKGFTFYIKHRNALFIGMDVYDGKDDNKPHELNQTNLDWLYGVLGNNTWAIAGDDVRQHVFSFTHEPAFKVGQHADCLDDNTITRNAFWVTLEEEPGCRLYFCGHDHIYDHAEADNGDSAIPNVHQMLVGTAGAPLKYDDYDDGGPWTLTNIAHRGKEDGDFYYGYVVTEVYGDNVRTHWKRRNSYTSTTFNRFEADNDVFEYSVPIDSDDSDAPEIKSVVVSDSTTVEVVFNEWLEETSAETAGNYTITGGSNPDVTVAVLDADNAKKVTLTTDTLSMGVQYTLTVNGVKDRSSNENASSDQETFTYIYTVKVNYNNDDAEEKDGAMNLKSTDLELVYDGSHQQIVGMRFNNVEISQGATINNAYIQFTVDEKNDSNPCSLTIGGEDVDNASDFTSSNLSSRTLTTASVSWQPAAWDDDDLGEAGEDQRTEDIKSVIQEIVNRPGWSSGNSSLVIIISGTGRRVAKSHNGEANAAPRLYVEFE
ncbi:MAG: right-handed parallel beta-helix repeat-containing protein [Planctomycetota bacterium]|jgi:hypothetical protein